MASSAKLLNRRSALLFLGASFLPLLFSRVLEGKYISQFIVDFSNSAAPLRKSLAIRRDPSLFDVVMSDINESWLKNFYEVRNSFLASSKIILLERDMNLVDGKIVIVSHFDSKASFDSFYRLAKMSEIVEVCKKRGHFVSLTRLV